MNVFVFIANFPSPPNKKDVTEDILKLWNHQPQTPAVADLATYIDRPLREDAKIPLTQDCFKRLDEDHCQPELLFRVSDDEIALDLSFHFVDSILASPPKLNTTENIFIPFWNNNISKLLLLALPAGSPLRDSSKNMSTGAARPDYGLQMGRVVPFRGEEKGPTNNEDPKAELRDKLLWTYKPAPYILGEFVLFRCSVVLLFIMHLYRLLR